MTENAVLYATRVEQCLLDMLQKYAPGAEVKVVKKHPDGGWKTVEFFWLRRSP